MEFINAVNGVLTSFPSLANCPKVLFAARLIQPAAVVVTTVALRKRYKNAFGQKGLFNHRCMLVGITAYALSNIVLAATLFYPMSQWIKICSVIFSAMSWEFFTATFLNGGLFNVKSAAGIKPTRQNVSWLAIGAISSAVMALGAGGLITISPIVFYAASFGLVLEAAIKYSGLRAEIVFAVFAEILLAGLYRNPFCGSPSWRLTVVGACIFCARNIYLWVSGFWKRAIFKGEKRLSAALWQE